MSRNIVNELTDDISETKNRIAKLEVKAEFHRQDIADLMDALEALAGYLKLDWKRVKAHIEFFPKEEE